MNVQPWIEKRWRKAIEELMAEGRLDFELSDIPKIQTKIQDELDKEESAAIKNDLGDYCFPAVQNTIIDELPNFYEKFLRQKHLENAK